MKNFLKKKEKKDKHPKVLDVGLEKDNKTIVFKKKQWKIEFTFEDLKNKFNQNKKIIFSFLGIFVLIFLIARYLYLTKAETVEVYPSSCLGGWQNPQNAAGKPDLSKDAPASSFNKNNSAYLSNAISQIYCGNFEGSSPDSNLQIKRAYLTFSWLVLSQEEEQSLISNSSFVQEINTENSSTIQVVNPISNSVSNTTTETSTENQTQTTTETSTQTSTETSTKTSTEIQTSTENNTTTSTDNSAENQTETQIQTSTQTSTETQAQTSTENSIVTSTEIQTTTQTQIQTTNQTTNQTTTQTPTETSTENTTTSQNQIPQPQETQAAGSQQNSTSSSESVPIINFLYKLLFSKVFAEENLTSTLEIQEQSTTNQNIVDSSNTTSTLNNESANSQNQTSSLESTSTQESTSTNNENLNQDNNQIQMPQDAFLEVLYTLDGQNWKHLGFVTKSNWKNLELDIPEVNFDNLSNLQISLKSIVSDFTPTIYLDGMILNIEYAREMENAVVVDQNQESQLSQEQQQQQQEQQQQEQQQQQNIVNPEEINFEITPSKAYFYNDENPAFILNNIANQSIWDKLQMLFGDKIEISDLVLFNPEGKKINFSFNVVAENNNYKISISNPSEWEDGTWKLKIQVNRFGKIYNSETSFNWKKRPEKRVVFNLNNQLVPSERYLEWHQEFKKVKTNIENQGGNFILNSDNTKLIFEGTCKKEYFVILGYRHLNDYKTNPTSFIYNKAFNCKNGSYYYELNDLPLNINPQTYYFLVAEQDASGSWYPISAIKPVEISIEER